MANVATVPTWASSLRESRAVAAGFALVGALPVLLFAYPPGTDFPHHEAVDALLAHPSRFHHLYTLNPGHPNQLFAAWTALVTAITSPLGASPDLAFRLALAAVVAWLLLGIASLDRRLGGRGWSAALCMPLVLGWTFEWGLAANLVGLGALAWTLPTLATACEERTVRAYARIAGTLVILYVCHESSMLVGAAVAGVQLVRKRQPTAVFGIALAAAIAIANRLRIAHSLEIPGRPLPTRFGSLVVKATSLPELLVGMFDPVAVLALTAMVALSLVLAARSPKGSDTANAKGDTSLRLVLAATALVTFGAYLALPSAYRGITFLAQRFAVVSLMLAIVALTARKNLGRAAKAAAATVTLGMLALALPEFADAAHGARDMARIVDAMAPDEAVVLLEVGASSERTFSPSSMADLYVARKGGRALATFTTSTVALVRQRTELQWIRTEDRITQGSLELRPAIDLRQFRYVIVHGARPAMLAQVARALAPEGQVIAAEGEWLLIESTLPRIDPFGPELPNAGETSAKLDLQTLRGRLYAQRKLAGAPPDELETLAGGPGSTTDEPPSDDLARRP